jgi:hypothetical protein
MMPAGAKAHRRRNGTQSAANKRLLSYPGHNDPDIVPFYRNLLVDLGLPISAQAP